ncbi:4'-phosphopantetheinyl transferase superfamily protein [Flavobacterium sp.]|uniref:4'-phosphopantetheinyl transferase family protein n=1 Tax=Flavobacterium sp. TaxID=239 RepID=UPI00333EFE46
MPFYKKIKINEHTIAYFWKISEDISWFNEKSELNDNSVSRLKSMQSVAHKKGYLAVRMLLQHIGLSDFDLFYNEFGKPYLKVENLEVGIKKHISISHSHEFSCICISNKAVGIDIEKCKEKTLKIASRFMEVSHIENLSMADKITKATIIWGIKESIFKLKNEKGISFPKHIFESPFKLADRKGNAKLIFNNTIEEFQFQFDIIEDYAFVCTLTK